MANVIINDTNLSNIADAIRSKNKSTETYKPGEMAAAIAALQLSENGSFSVDSCDVTLISELARVAAGGSNYTFWTEWRDYVTDIEDVQVLIYLLNGNTYFYIKGFCNLTDGKLYAYCNVYDSKYGKCTLTEANINETYMTFTDELGLELFSKGSRQTPPAKGAIYLITSKEVA